MNEVSKSSAYPETVQPGIPKLPTNPPAGWQRTRFGEHLFEEKRPVTMNDDTEYDLVTVKRARGGVVKRETKCGADISVKSQFEVKSGDFLISKRQIVHGACGLVPDDLDGATVSNEYAVLRGNDTIDLQFLKHFAHSIYFQQTCFHSSIGVHIEKMIFKTEQWFDWEFDLPPLKEQRCIADALSTWDESLRVNRALIENSLALKAALLEGLFCQVFEVPASGQPISLGQIASLEKRRVDPSSLHEETKCIELEHIEQNTGRLVGFDDARNLASLKAVVEPGYILFGKLRPYLRKYHFAEFSGACSTEIWPIKADASLCHPKWLYYLTQTDAFFSAVSVSSGSKMPRADWGLVSSVEFNLPNLVAQETTVRMLDTAENIVDCLIHKQACLESEKKALMQQLLTGKRRVRIAKEITV